MGSNQNTTEHRAVGIDLGTTCCVLASFTEAGTPGVLPLGKQKVSVPSLLYFDEDGTLKVGEEAGACLLESPGRGAFLFKRRMGQQGWYLSIDESHYTARDLSSLLLGYLRKEAGLGLSNASAVITVPAYFDDSARRDTIEAARSSGWKVIGLLNEPTAAAIAYSHYHDKEEAHGTYVVFDLGGGTLDVTLLDRRGEEIDILASIGDTSLGGQDWDDAIAWKVAQSFRKQYGWDPLDEPQAFEQLRRDCQKAREDLSFRAALTLQYEFEGAKLEFPISRKELNAWCRPFVERCLQIVAQALEEGGRTKDALCGVVLAGGGSRMPMIQDALTHFSGRPLDLRLDPEQAIAIGAALRAARLLELPSAQRRSDADKSLPGQCLKESSAHPLGFLILRDGLPTNRLLFPRHSPLPAKRSLRGFTTSANEQTEIEIYLMQSDAPHPTPDQLFAAYRILNIPPKPAGEIQLELSFEVGLDALISLSAMELNTNATLHTELIEAPTLRELLQPPARDVLLAIDCSASMKGRPILEAKFAAYQFLKELQPEGLRLGLVSFGDPGVHLRVGLQPDPLLIRAYLSQLQASGTTPLDAAIECALQELTQPRLDAPERERHLLILTDGVPDHPERATLLAARARKAGIRILTIGIGEDVDAAFLTHQICTHPSDYRAVGDPVELSILFVSLASELSGGSSAIAKWAPINTEDKER